MVPKDKAARAGQVPVLKVVRASAGEPAAAPKSARGEGIFSDTRSGRDRREEEGTPVEDPRRQNPERRRSKPPSAWWLERDYVESHHFVQKPPHARNLLDDDSTAGNT